MAVGGEAMGRAEEAEEEAIVGRLAAAAAADGPDTPGVSVGGGQGSSGVSNGSRKDISLTAATPGARVLQHGPSLAQPTRYGISMTRRRSQQLQIDIVGSTWQSCSHTESGSHSTKVSTWTTDTAQLVRAVSVRCRLFLCC